MINFYLKSLRIKKTHKKPNKNEIGKKKNKLHAKKVKLPPEKMDCLENILTVIDKPGFRNDTQNSICRYSQKKPIMLLLLMKNAINHSQRLPKSALGFCLVNQLNSLPSQKRISG